MKKTMLQRHDPIVPVKKSWKLKVEEPIEPEYDGILEEAMMEVAADLDQPFPAPHVFGKMMKTPSKTKTGKPK